MVVGGGGCSWALEPQPPKEAKVMIKACDPLCHFTDRFLKISAVLVSYRRCADNVNSPRKEQATILLTGS